MVQPGLSDGSPIAELLTAVGQAAYVWDIETDRLEWTDAAHEVLGLAATTPIDSASRFAALFDPDALTTRREAVFGASAPDHGHGVPFEVEYPLTPGGRAKRLWVQDRGRWYAGPEGRPTRVVGVVSRLGAHYEHAHNAATLARFDPLTGQLSRARLLEIAGATLAASLRMQTACCLVLASLTNLGAINESYGYDVGDLAVVEVARRFRLAMRGGDTLGRFSTSTFGFVLQECDRGDLDVVLRRLAAAIHDEPIVTPAGPVSVRLAVGGVVAPRHARDVAEFVAKARAALARAAAIPGAIHVYAPDPEREAARRTHMRLAEQLVSALGERRVRLAFQPVFRAATGEHVWSEALVRIVTKDGEIISGGPLASAAEQVGLIHMLDRRALDLAAAHLSSLPEARVAVNVSAATTADASWLEALTSWLAMRPDLADRLMVEVTETAAIADLGVTSAFVTELHARGVRVAIDDFGAGHTSFKALRELSVDLVKIDGSFVRDLETDPRSGAFVRALLALARELGFETVAEQIETRAAADMLTAWGATYLQGELLAAPQLA